MAGVVLTIVLIKQRRHPRAIVGIKPDPHKTFTCRGGIDDQPSVDASDLALMRLEQRASVRKVG